VTRELQGRVIRAGRARGEALVSAEPVSFYGGVDLDTGRVVEPGHPLQGQALAGRVLVIPRGKGSTVGSWAILRLHRRGLGPVAILCQRCETIVAVGAILAELPCVDGIDPARIRSGQTVTVDGARILLDREGAGETP
jgi:hypothetical protein